MHKEPFQISNKFYDYHSLSGPSSLIAPPAKYVVIFCYQGTVVIESTDSSHSLVADHICILETVSDLVISVQANSKCVVLIKDLVNSSQTPTFSCFPLSACYKVSKPWGHEVWITGDTPTNNVVLKSIFIKAGTRTSLQVHKEKFESNFLVSGSAIFTPSSTPFVDKSFDYPLDNNHVGPGVCLDVSPLTVHQVTAVSDIHLIEASTNHLDDVIRLQDDSGRSDGKILSEHK